MALKTIILLSAAAIAGCSSDTKRTEMSFEEAPLAVRMGIEKAFPDADVDEIERQVSKKDGTVYYEVELKTKDGDAKDVKFAPDGELVEMQ